MKREDVKREGEVSLSSRFTSSRFESNGRDRPARRTIAALLRRRDRRGLLGADVDLAALEFDLAVLEGEQGVVLAGADVKAGHELGAALADNDRSGGDERATVRLHAAVLGIGVAAVLRRAAAFLMSHGNLSWFEIAN